MGWSVRCVNLLKVIKISPPRVGLRLLVEGKAISEWVEPAGKTNRTFRGEDRYVNYTTYLFGDKDGELLEIQAGSYAYKFACHLPPNIPYSVDGEFGSIKYKIDAKLDIPWSICDVQDKLNFTVARNDDLNLIPELKLPQEVEEIKKFGWGFCGSSKPLIVKVHMRKSGYALGENVYMTLKYLNESNHSVNHTMVTLLKKEKFISSDPVTKDKVKKSKVIDSLAEGVKKNSEVKIEHFFQIPRDIMTTNRKYCEVYQISYEIKIVASTSGCSSSIVLKLPITIGNVCVHEVPSININ